MKTMNNMKKFASILLALVMVLAMAAPAMAQTVDSGKDGEATITIKNAAKGETYRVFKLFDATVNGTGGIVYTGTIPESLKTIFKVNDAGFIVVVEGKSDEEVTKAVSDWAAAQNVGDATATAVSDGSELTFTNLKYGYYAVTTTQGATVTVDSTNPDATIYDKNSKTPGIVKSVNDDNVYIGQTVTYTATATTANYIGAGATAEKVVQYEISDTLPEFLTDVTVTSITIGGAEYKVEGAVPQFADVDGDNEKEIIIPWVGKDGNHLYANGAQIVVTYTAKVTDKAGIDGKETGDTVDYTTGNVNVVTLQPYVDKDENDDGKPDKTEEKWEDKEKIYTYAAALEKVDDKNNALAGATFQVYGLTVTGSKGNYTVVSYDSTSTAAGTTMETDDNGKLVIKGLESGTQLEIYEVAAPDGYMKLTTPGKLNPQVINEVVTVTSSTSKTYYDEEGNVTQEETESYTETTTITYNQNLNTYKVTVVNNPGTELPETGGMGTTLIYAVGALLVAGAVVVMISKKRAASK